MAKKPRRARSLTSIDDLTPDPHNANLGTDRGRAMVDQSLEVYGAGRSALADRQGVIIAGNKTVNAWRKRGGEVEFVHTDGRKLLVVVRDDLDLRESPALARGLAYADNRTAAVGLQWDVDQILADQRAGVDLSFLWQPSELAEIIAAVGGSTGLTDVEQLPEPRATSIVAGDVFALGDHRLMCGDSTDARQVAILVDGRRLVLLHDDPPYGMGKEADGIANDNLYGPKLDAFQMAWWGAWLPMLEPNASAYIWGTAPDLWRLWYLGGLASSDWMVRNEIVWAKGSGFGMASEGGHSYPPESERALFLMRGQQFLGSQNADQYWQGYEPLRAWLESERDKAGFSNSDVNRMTSSHMAGHWFSRSQFTPITSRAYQTLQAAAKGAAFVPPYEDLGRLVGAEAFGDSHRRELADRMRAARSYFDNTHDAMTDVWTFPRVAGAERFGHATPKPVALAARALLSSAPVGGDVGVPFGGTGPEFLAGEQYGRRIVGMELDPGYCQAIVDRWEAFTGKTATKVAAGVLSAVTAPVTSRTGRRGIKRQHNDA